MKSPGMKTGIYEQLVSVHLRRLLDELQHKGLTASISEVDAAERAGVLSEQFALILRSALEDVRR